jgi:YNFM family putative membrane transporter
MYATQPIQPLLALEFDISIVKASSFTAVVMFFLAIAPIIYGYILERIDAKRVLMSASLILFVTNIFLSLSVNYEMFLFARVIEAIVIPAILTACMSILASDKENIKLNMSIYVASTVFGGLMGRLMAGIIANEFGWRAVFLALSLALLFGLYFIKRFRFNVETNMVKAKPMDVLYILHDKRFVLIYLLMFCMFFVFAGVLNILPFRIKELFPDSSESQIGLLYIGYGMGIVVSLTIHKIIKFFKGEVKTILAGILVFALSNIFFVSLKLYTLFITVFILCIGMFIVHTVSTRLANSLKESQKALTSGMYLSFYYIGGTVGSIVPPIIYAQYGWNFTILVFVIVNILIFGVVFLNKELFKGH